MLPSLIWFAMSCTAFKPDEQNRFTVEAATVLGKPAARDAARSLYAALPSLTFLYLSHGHARGVGPTDISQAYILNHLRINL